MSRTHATSTAVVDPEPAVQPKPTRTAVRGYLLAVVGAVLLYLCYFPVAWGWLGWIALVPWLGLVRFAGPSRRIYFAAWLGGLVFFTPILQWMRVADPRMYFTWIALALYCSLFVVAGVWLVRRLDRRTSLPLVLTVPTVWTALEFLRAHLLTGFPWYFLGHTQHDFLPIIQISDVTGAYGVSFLVAIVNVVVFEWLCVFAPVRRYLGLPETPVRLPIVSSVVAASLFAGVVGYGFWRLGQSEFAVGPRVALVQGNVPQRVRNNDGGSMLRHYHVLSMAACRLQPKPDLVAWPETSFPDDWRDVAAGVSLDEAPQEWQKVLKEQDEVKGDVGRLWPANVLLGLNTTVLQADHREKRYNSSLLFREDGSVGPRYDKIHRVPFGEYVPFKDVLPFMNAFAPYDFDYSVSPGEGFSRFDLKNHTFGVVICYEDSDPGLARQYVAPGTQPVDFIVNVSNDGWFDGTAEHEEHLAICRFRAVECRRSVLRAVNVGVSAVIDPNGRVLAPKIIGTGDFPAKSGEAQETFRIWEVPTDGAESLPPGRWREFKKVAGVLTADVPIDHRGSVYAGWGDWLPWGCWLIVAVGLLTGIVWPRRPE